MISLVLLLISMIQICHCNSAVVPYNSETTAIAAVIINVSSTVV